MRGLFYGAAMLALIALWSLAAVSCGSSGTSNAPSSGSATTKAGAADASEVDKQLVEAAKKEGRVVYYLGSGTKKTVETIIGSFNKLYPEIEVQYVEGTGTTNYSRITMEASSGQYVGDMMSGGATTLNQLKSDGLIMDWAPPNGKFVDNRLLVATTAGTPVYVNFYGLLLNTSMVKEGEISSWKDLLNPKWKGKLIFVNPTMSGVGSTIFVATYKSLGRDFHEQLAKQNPTILNDDRAAEAAVARNEAAVLIPGQLKAESFQSGAPVNWVHPKEGVAFTPVAGAILKHAPHPNAAKLFFDFLLTEESQAAMEAADLRAPSRKGVAQHPELKIDNMTFLETPNQTDQDNMKKDWFPLAAQIYGIK